jgi:hypothetical protein
MANFRPGGEFSLSPFPAQNPQLLQPGVQGRAFQAQALSGALGAADDAPAVPQGLLDFLAFTFKDPAQGDSNPTNCPKLGA